MVRKSSFDPRRLREEIAIGAARLIAEDGLDYASAKRRAARQIIGDTRTAGDWLPDNDQVEEELREYQALFQADSQPLVLRKLREVALQWMKRLAAFDPYLTGAVLNGTAGPHSDIYLQLFCENTKDVSIFLLNADIDYDVSESRHFAGRGMVETLAFMSSRADRATGEPGVGIILSLYQADDVRGALRGDARGRVQRAGPQAVAALLNETAVNETAVNETAVNETAADKTAVGGAGGESSADLNVASGAMPRAGRI